VQRRQGALYRSRGSADKFILVRAVLFELVVEVMEARVGCGVEMKVVGTLVRLIYMEFFPFEMALSLFSQVLALILAFCVACLYVPARHCKESRNMRKRRFGIRERKVLASVARSLPCFPPSPHPMPTCHKSHTAHSPLSDSPTPTEQDQ
jgi:hypothetical protein